MSGGSGRGCEAPPDWLRRRGDSTGATIVCDCSAELGGAAGGAEEHFRSLLSGSAAGTAEVLLCGVGGLSAESINKMRAAALRAGFSAAKVEYDIAGSPGADFLAALLRARAGDVIAAMPPISGGAGATGEWTLALEALKRAAATAAREGLIQNLKVRTKVPASRETAGRIFALLAASGVVFVVADAGGARGLEGLCSETAERLGMSVQLRLRRGERTFRSAALRSREAAELALEIPYSYISGRPTPLGAVFQLNFGCNQKCVFCTSDRSLPSPSAGTIGELLREVFALGIRRVVFTGGEPTLDGNLMKYITMCRDAGVLETSLYTNGMALAARGYAAELAAAGLDLALISLHSADEKTADAITGCAKGWRKTVAGVENAHGAGIFTVLNFVINALNYRGAADFVRFAAERFPGAAVNFSWVAPVMPETARREIIPRFTDAAPHAAKALDACADLGVRATGLEPHWGAPPCALGGHAMRYFPPMLPLSERLPGFVKSIVCRRCDLDAACPGVRKRYADMYGLDELKPFQRPRGAIR